MVGGGACGVGHLPDLLAVGVDAGVFGLLGEAGEQIGLAGEERSPLGGIDDELVVPVAELGEVVQEVGDVAGGDPGGDPVVVGVLAVGVVDAAVGVDHVVLLSRSRAVGFLMCRRWPARSR